MLQRFTYQFFFEAELASVFCKAKAFPLASQCGSSIMPFGKPPSDNRQPASCSYIVQRKANCDGASRWNNVHPGFELAAHSVSSSYLVINGRVDTFPRRSEGGSRCGNGSNSGRRREPNTEQAGRIAARGEEKQTPSAIPGRRGTGETYSRRLFRQPTTNAIVPPTFVVKMVSRRVC